MMPRDNASIKYNLLFTEDKINPVMISQYSFENDIFLQE